MRKNPQVKSYHGHFEISQTPDLLIDLELARDNSNYKKIMAKYANPVLLILDEWLLLKPTESEQRDIFELLHTPPVRGQQPASTPCFTQTFRRSFWWW